MRNFSLDPAHRISKSDLSSSSRTGCAARPAHRLSLSDHSHSVECELKHRCSFIIIRIVKCVVLANKDRAISFVFCG